MVTVDRASVSCCCCMCLYLVVFCLSVATPRSIYSHKVIKYCTGRYVFLFSLWCLSPCITELEELENEYPDRISIWYTLDVPSASWRYSRGFIDQEMIQRHLPPPGAETLILCCGPPPMVENACKKNLLELGYDRRDIVCF